MTEPTDPTRAASDPASDFLRQFLAGRDVDCPGCGYNVRDLVGDRCPECGQAIMLSVQLSEPKQGWLITGLVGLAAGAGFGGLLLVFFLILTILHDGGPSGSQRWLFLGITGGGLIVHGLLLWIWIVNWNRIRRASPAVRRMLVIIAWALPLVLVIVFTVNVR